MPTYLCHGFRWQRRSIRVYVVVQNLDDASPEWIIPAKSSQCILESFYNIFEFLPYRAPPSRSSGGWSAGSPISGIDIDDGDDYDILNTAAYNNANSSLRNGGRSRSQSATGRSQSQGQGQGQRNRSRSQSRSQSRSRAHSGATREEPPPPLPLSGAHGKGTNHNGREDDISSQDWSVVKVLEEYDPMNLDEVSRPYAYVADYVKRIDLGASIFEEIQKYEEQIRADRDPPMTLAGGNGSSDETGRGAGGGKKPSNSKKHQGSGGGGWFEKMRDQLQRGEEIKWYVVVNGDEVRDWPDEPISKSELMGGSSSSTLSHRPTATREQKQHHAQYMLQQSIFSQNDRSSRSRRMDVPGTGGGRPPLPLPLPLGPAPAVPEKDLPVVPFPGQRLRGPGMGNMGMAGHQEQHQQQQKSHGKSGGGFRRLFGKNVSSNNTREDFYAP